MTLSQFKADKKTASDNDLFVKLKKSIFFRLACGILRKQASFRTHSLFGYVQYKRNQTTINYFTFSLHFFYKHIYR